MRRHGALTTNIGERSGLDGLKLGVLLGQGGMCEVRLATTATGERVAVKFPRSDGVNRAAARALVRREFRFLNEFSHPNVVAVLALARLPFRAALPEPEFGIVMEYVGGGDLVSLAGSPPRHWVPVSARIARALDCLHGAGVVHGDIKPRNVLVRDGDVPCLIDFALSVRIGCAAPKGGGTPAYQRRRPVGEAESAADVHAFAVMVYELWTGRLPFGNNRLPRSRERWRGMPECDPTPGVHGLEQVAAAVSDVIETNRIAQDSGVRPLRHALESVVIEE